MTTDAETLAFYDAEAPVYADHLGDGGRAPYLMKFIAALPAGGRALDLGAGPGWAAARMAAAGLDVLAWDASAGLLAEAERRHGLRTRRARFDELDDEAAWDGIWASFSLLHAAKADMPRLLAACARALRPGGLLYLGLKAGVGERRDRLGRLYAYYEADELEVLLAGAGLAARDVRERPAEAGYDGTPTRALHAFARRPD